jgi:peptidoglycan-associated lipoprotein
MRREEKKGKMRRAATVATVLLGAGFLTACQAKAPATAAREVPTPVPQAATPAPPAPTPSAERDDVLSANISELNRRGYLKDAFFDFDESRLRDDARTSLSSDSVWLKKYVTMEILLEGHCDERGTIAYNLALGEKRANATRDYLIALGVEGSRLKTVSYGKERPFCDQSTESCWQENRRAHLAITAK